MTLGREGRLGNSGGFRKLKQVTQSRVRNEVYNSSWTHGGRKPTLTRLAFATSTDAGSELWSAATGEGAFRRSETSCALSHAHMPTWEEVRSWKGLSSPVT